MMKNIARSQGKSRDVSRWEWLATSIALSVCAAAFSRGAEAAAVSGDMTTKVRSSSIGGTTNSFLAHSKIVRPKTIGPNDRSSFAENAVELLNPVPTLLNKTIVVHTGFANQNRTTFFSVAGHGPVAKPPIPEGDVKGTQDLSSTTYLTTALEDGKADALATQVVWNSFLINDFISASGKLEPPESGVMSAAAAAAAFDPYTLSPGNYQADWIINTSLQLDGVNTHESGGVTYFGLDSRFTDLDTFYERQQPFQEALWALTIYTGGQTVSLSNISVEFFTHPQARASGILNPAESDSQIASALHASLTLNGGIVSLTDYSVFSSGTTFIVRPQDGEIQFGEALNTGLAAIPEPTTIALGVFAPFMMLLGGIRHQRDFLLLVADNATKVVSSGQTQDGSGTPDGLE
jgi:hypothetical protein